MCVHVDIWVLFQFLAGSHNVFINLHAAVFMPLSALCWTLNALASYVRRWVVKHPTICFVSNWFYAYIMFLNLFWLITLICLA